jgi:hypothetical protein
VKVKKRQKPIFWQKGSDIVVTKQKNIQEALGELLAKKPENGGV